LFWLPELLVTLTTATALFVSTVTLLSVHLASNTKGALCLSQPSAQLTRICFACTNIFSASTCCNTSWQPKTAKQSPECLQGAKLAQQASEDGLMYLQHSHLVEVVIGKVIRLALATKGPKTVDAFNNDNDITPGATYQGSVWKQTTQPKLVAKPW
jgi:hypothetical protein